MGEIRFVGTGETCGYPYLVCKKTLSATLHQIFNDFILSAMLLHQWRHRSVTIATVELSNVLRSPIGIMSSR